MKTTDFKLWDVFGEPMTDKLSVVVKIDSTHVYAISSIKSIYKLKRHDLEVCYQLLDLEPEVVFEVYNNTELTKYQQNTYDQVMKDYGYNEEILLTI